MPKKGKSITKSFLQIAHLPTKPREAWEEQTGSDLSQTKLDAGSLQLYSQEGSLTIECAWRRENSTQQGKALPPMQ